jgi:prepilin-type N-terminal cleavage/methylation domain-containing protein
MRIHRRYPGFTITEMLFVLMLVGIASLLAARLFTASMRVIRTAPAVQDRFAVIDRMSASLRQDVWSADSIDVSNPHALALRSANQSTVQWSFFSDEIVRRTSQGDQLWPIAITLTVQRDGSQVVVKGPDADELRFTSQALALSAGGKP